MRVLVTGAAGFVGVHLVRAIAARFPEAVILAADIAAPDRAALAAFAGLGERVATRRLDVTDRAAVAEAVEAFGPSHVVHAAAVTPGPQREAERPAEIVDINLGGTLNLVDAATAAPGLARLIVFSSAAVYGNAPDLPSPLAEEGPLAPANLYGIAKAAGEALVRRYGELRGVSCLSVRVAGAYGPFERPTEARERMSQVHRLAEALRQGRPVGVHGPDVPRDWVHGDDVGSAVAALLALEAPRHGVYNIGSGRTVGWHGTVELFRQHGLEARWTESPEEAEIALAASEARPALSIARLAAETGYAPRPLAEGLQSLFSEGGAA